MLYNFTEIHICYLELIIRMMWIWTCFYAIGNQKELKGPVSETVPDTYVFNIWNFLSHVLRISVWQVIHLFAMLSSL